MNCQEFWNTIPELGECEQSHLQECAACAARMMRYRELEAGFRGLAAGSRKMGAPPRVEARLRTAFRQQAGTEHRSPSRPWIPAVTWVAAFAALAASGPYQTVQRYYRPAPDLIAGFAIRTAVPA